MSILKRYIKNHLTIAIAVLLFILIVMSVFRVGYYYVKFAINDTKFFKKSDEEIKLSYYGDEYVFFNKIKDFPSNRFYLISNNGKAYLLGRYVLYPKKIFLIKDPNYAESNSLILLYQDHIPKSFLLSDIEIEKPIYSNKDVLIGYVLKKQ